MKPGFIPLLVSCLAEWTLAAPTRRADISNKRNETLQLSTKGVDKRNVDLSKLAAGNVPNLGGNIAVNPNEDPSELLSILASYFGRGKGKTASGLSSGSGYSIADFLESLDSTQNNPKSGGSSSLGGLGEIGGSLSNNDDNAAAKTFDSLTAYRGPQLEGSDGIAGASGLSGKTDPNADFDPQDLLGYLPVSLDGETLGSDALSGDVYQGHSYTGLKGDESDSTRMEGHGFIGANSQPIGSSGASDGLGQADYSGHGFLGSSLGSPAEASGHANIEVNGLNGLSSTSLSGSRQGGPSTGNDISS